MDTETIEAVGVITWKVELTYIKLAIILSE